LALIGPHRIPDHKSIWIGLQSIYGLGRVLSKRVCERAALPLERKVSELSDDERMQLFDIIRNEYVIDDDLRREIGSHIQRLKTIRCYRGVRHELGMPVRGQRNRNRKKYRGKAPSR
jgi:small subunit ribosomal protein S13